MCGSDPHGPAGRAFRFTALHMAVMSQRVDIAKFLLAEGADINAKFEPHGDSSFELAERSTSKGGQEVYQLLKLRTYYTSGETETKAWTIKEGMLAPQAAGVIHTDFERGFIRAETVAYDDLVAAGSVQEAKAQGNYRSEGKEYEVKEGDVLLFRFNV